MMTCAMCGKEFERTHPSQKYCSDPCAMKAIREHSKKRTQAPGYQEKAKAYVKAYRDRLKSTPEGQAKLAAILRKTRDRQNEKQRNDPETRKKHRDYMREYMRKKAAKKRAEAMQQPTTTGTNA